MLITLYLSSLPDEKNIFIAILGLIFMIIFI